jgi:hypothetical protein
VVPALSDWNGGVELILYRTPVRQMRNIENSIILLFNAITSSSCHSFEEAGRKKGASNELIDCVSDDNNSSCEQAAMKNRGNFEILAVNFASNSRGGLQLRISS